MPFTPTKPPRGFRNPGRAINPAPPSVDLTNPRVLQQIQSQMASRGGAPISDPAPDGPTTTYEFIFEKAPTNWFRGSQVAGSQTLGDYGTKSFLITTIYGSPSYGASTPMALEQKTKTIGLSGVDGHVTAAAINPALAEGTFIAFFKPAALTGDKRLFSKEVGGGSTAVEIFINSATQVGIIVQNGGSNQSVVNLPSVSVTVDRWHMLAFRQPKDGSGINGFFNGAFFANGGGATQATLTGTMTKDSWFASATGSGYFGIGTRAVGFANYAFNGEYFDMILDARVWTDAELTALWQLALTNGLDAEAL